MESNLAFSIGKTFGYISKIMQNIDNINFEEKTELSTLFSNLLNDIKKVGSNGSIKEIEQKAKIFSQINDIESSKILAKEIYSSFKEFNKSVYMKLKYDI